MPTNQAISDQISINLFISHQNMTYKLQVNNNVSLLEYIEQLMNQRIMYNNLKYVRPKTTAQSYIIYDTNCKILYDEKKLNKKFKDVAKVNQSRIIDLTLLRADEFSQYQDQIQTVIDINLSIPHISKSFHIQVDEDATVFELIEQFQNLGYIAGTQVNQYGILDNIRQQFYKKEELMEKIKDIISLNIDRIGDFCLLKVDEQKQDDSSNVVNLELNIISNIETPLQIFRHQYIEKILKIIELMLISSLLHSNQKYKFDLI